MTQPLTWGDLDENEQNLLRMLQAMPRADAEHLMALIHAFAEVYANDGDRRVGALNDLRRLYHALPDRLRESDELHALLASIGVDPQDWRELPQ